MHHPGFLHLVDDARGRIRECTPAEVMARRQRGERFHLLDIREESEVALGRAAGSEHIGRGVLERDIEGMIPDKDAEIVLYCGGGFRSALAADSLQRMGYTKVISMDGGIRAWRAAGYPMES